MASAIEALGNSLFAGTVPVDSIVSKYQEEGDKARGEIQDKIDVRESSLGEISRLQSAIVKIKAAASAIADPLQTGFGSKTAIPTTTEGGLSGSEFLKNIRVDNTAIAGPTTVKVDQVATHSDLVIRRSNVANTGFAAAGALNLNGTLTLTLAGTAVNTTFIATDTLDDAINKINTSILTGNHEFEAFKLQGPGGAAFIEVRAKNTGAASSIVFTNYNDNTGVVGTTMEQNNITNGQNSSVYVNGIQHQTASNKFVNIVPGVSFEVTRANTLANTNTISVSEDKSAVKKLIADFGDAVNELSYLVAKNSKSSRSIADVQFADPTSAFDSFDDPNAPLRGSSLLAEAQDLFDKLVTRRPGTTGDIGSLLDLGFGIQTETKEGDNFSYERLYFADKAQFEKAFDDNFQAVLDYFVTDTKVTNGGGNTGYVQYIPSESAKTITDPSIIGHNINLAVTYSGASAVTGVVATVNGGAVNGIINHNASTGRYEISFEGTVLEGIDFSIDPNGAAGVTENSTIVYKSGVVNEIRQDARGILSDDGLSGTSVVEGSQIQDRVTADKEELSRVDAEFKKLIDDMKNVGSQLAFMEQQTNLLLASIEAILG
ncbi:MAG: flagellar filament capping protein FliD, partial [Pseudomonadota bacterium]